MKTISHRLTICLCTLSFLAACDSSDKDADAKSVDPIPVVDPVPIEPKTLADCEAENKPWIPAVDGDVEKAKCDDLELDSYGCCLEQIEHMFSGQGDVAEEYIVRVRDFIEGTNVSLKNGQEKKFEGRLRCAGSGSAVYFYNIDPDSVEYKKLSIDVASKDPKDIDGCEARPELEELDSEKTNADLED